MRSNERARPAVPVPARAIRAVHLALAGTGGYLGRQEEGPPGWQIRWLGRRSLLVEGVCKSRVQLNPNGGKRVKFSQRLRNRRYIE